MTGQNILFTPRDYAHKHRIPALKGGRLHFYVENQGVHQWSTLPDGDDPPVFGRYEGKGRWAQEQIVLSEHLILACLFEAIICHARYGAWTASLPKDRLGAVVTDMPPLAIAPWRWGNMRFFVGRGAFACVSDNGEAAGKRYYSVRLGAKTEKPLQFQKPLLNDGWDFVAI